MHEPTSRRRLLGGAAAAAGAVWVAPSVLTTQAAAAATCQPGTLDFDAFPLDSVFTSATVNGVTVTRSNVTLAGTTLLATNNTIRASPNGGFASRALQFQQLPNAIGVGQDITFSFSVPVSNLSFTLTDIDNVTGGWGDRIQMLTPGYTFAIPPIGSRTPLTPAGNVIGIGSAADRFRNSNTNFNYDDDANRGNVTITYAGPVNSFSFRYQNAVNTGGGNQRIGILGITWTC